MKGWRFMIFFLSKISQSPFLPNILNVPKRGRINECNEPSEIIVFYAGVQGSPITIKK